jgi:hypothetical protein
VKLSEICTVLIQGPSFLPCSSDTWVILPVVEKIEMMRICVVNSDHRKMFLKMWYPPAIDDRSRFRFWLPYRMHSVPW